MSCLRQQSVVSAFLRLHPLLSADAEALSRFGSLVQSGETVAVDLTLSEDALWRQMRSNHRRDVTKSLARGEIADVDQTWSSLRMFVQAYRETMARVGAASYISFPMSILKNCGSRWANMRISGPCARGPQLSPEPCLPNATALSSITSAAR